MSVRIRSRVPRVPKCGSRYLAKMGLGTQQVEDALRALLPDDVAVIRMDADSTRGKDGHKTLLEEFDAAECAVLLGTQMIAKGLDFPEVTLAAVVMADYALKMPDFRAGERAFDLLEQLAGRSGRGERPGSVVIQTYLPHDPVIRAVGARTTARCFATTTPPSAPRRSIRPMCGSRASWPRAGARTTCAPIYGRWSRRCDPTSLASAGKAGDAIDSSLPQVLGPVPCVIERANDRFRHHFLIKAALDFDLPPRWRVRSPAIPPLSASACAVDVGPLRPYVAERSCALGAAERVI